MVLALEAQAGLSRHGINIEDCPTFYQLMVMSSLKGSAIYRAQNLYCHWQWAVMAQMHRCSIEFCRLTVLLYLFSELLASSPEAQIMM